RELVPPPAMEEAFLVDDGGVIERERDARHQLRDRSGLEDDRQLSIGKLRGALQRERALREGGAERAAGDAREVPRDDFAGDVDVGTIDELDRSLQAVERRGLDRLDAAARHER